MAQAEEEVDFRTFNRSRRSQKSIGEARQQETFRSQSEQQPAYQRQNANNNMLSLSEVHRQSEVQASIYSKDMLNQIQVDKQRDPKSRKRRMICRIIQVMLLIVSIPLQVSLSNWLQEHEIEGIRWMQSHVSFNDGSLYVIFFRVVRYFTRMDAMINFHTISFLSSDSLLAYKTTLCYCFGNLLITILKLIYAEPRPNWVDSTIKVPSGECDFGYGNPTQSTFNFIFFFSYSSYMQFHRYVKVNERKPWLIWMACIFVVLGELAIVATFWISAVSFLYQQLISLLYTVIYITGCINFDKEIMNFCEKSGFMLRSSRRNKFHIFFASIAAYVVIYSIALGLGDAWTNNITQVENAFASYRENCPEAYAIDPKAINELGAIRSTNSAVFMFYLTGMAFGAPYSMTRINVVDWIKTVWYKKLIRVIIALAINFGLWYLFQFLFGFQTDKMNYIVFYLTIGFFMYGPYIYLCCQRNLLVSPYTAQSQNQMVREDSMMKYEEKGLERLSSLVSQPTLTLPTSEAKDQ